MRRTGLPGTKVTKMEELRCKIAAIRMEDSRCQELFEGAVVEVEDQRCTRLAHSLVIEIEDSRFDSMAVRMEDPRCSGLRTRW